MFDPTDIVHDEFRTGSRNVASKIASTALTKSSPEVAQADHNKFTTFSRLPLETRDLIWSFAAPGSRVFEAGDHPWSRARLSSISRFAAVPAVLHATKESRRVALLVLEPFAGRWGKPIYFNFETDILRIRGYLALITLCGIKNFSHDNLKKHFPLDVREWHVKLHHIEIAGFDSRFDTEALQWMKSLKTLKIERWSATTLQDKERAQKELRLELATHWLGPVHRLPEITVLTKIV